MRKFILYIITTIAILSVSSCHRQELEDPNLFLAHIPVSIDWTESLLSMKQVGNVSLYFYPKGGGEPIVKVSDNLYYNLIELPIGEYSVLVFNDMVNNVVGVSYQDDAAFDRFSVNMIQTKNYVPGFYEIGANEVIVTPHSRMGGWCLDKLIVDESVVRYTRSEAFKGYIMKLKSRASAMMAAVKLDSNVSGSNKEDISVKAPIPPFSNDITKASLEALNDLSDVVIQPKTTVIDYRVRVENLNSAMQIKVYMKGNAKGTYLAKGDNISADKPSRNVYELMVANREYDNPDKGIDGYINFNLTTFGREPMDEKYELSFVVVLQTGEIKTYERDITNQMVLESGKKIKIELIDKDNLLTLPVSSDAGFNVDGWGDDIIVNL